MALLDLVEENIIKTPLVGTSKHEILSELVEVLEKAGKITQPQGVMDALLAREDLGSTGLANGIAVPHAKTADVSDLTLAIGLAPDGVDFDSLDGIPSKLFFMLLAPPDKSGPHIEALSEIAKITKSKAFCRMILSAEDAKEVEEIFKEE